MGPLFETLYEPCQVSFFVCRGSRSECTVRLGAVCAEELKLRARERAQCAPRTRHAFTEQEWRIHHPQQTRFGITRARNKAYMPDAPAPLSP
jgi:hypothetical protein